MNGKGEERVSVCVCTHASVCTSLCPCMPAHVFLCVQCVFCTICSYANNIKSSFTAGMTKTLRGEGEGGGEGVKALQQD